MEIRLEMMIFKFLHETTGIIFVETFYLSSLFVYRAINKLELIRGESIRAKTNTKVYEKLLFIKSSCRSILASFHSR